MPSRSLDDDSTPAGHAGTGQEFVWCSKDLSMDSMTCEMAVCMVCLATMEWRRFVVPARSVRMNTENATAITISTASMPSTTTNADPALFSFFIM